MAKFSKELRPMERDRFIAREEARREAGRSFEGNRYVRCKRCKFTMTEAEAADADIKACPQCGSEEAAEVLNLPYDPANERVSVVTLKQALQTQRAKKWLAENPTSPMPRKLVEEMRHDLEWGIEWRQKELVRMRELASARCVVPGDGGYAYVPDAPAAEQPSAPTVRRCPCGGRLRPAPAALPLIASCDICGRAEDYAPTAEQQRCACGDVATHGEFCWEHSPEGVAEIQGRVEGLDFCDCPPGQCTCGGNTETILDSDRPYIPGGKPAQRKESQMDLREQVRMAIVSKCDQCAGTSVDANCHAEQADAALTCFEKWLRSPDAIDPLCPHCTKLRMGLADELSAMRREASDGK